MNTRSIWLVVLLALAVTGIPTSSRAAPADAGLVLEAVQVLERTYVDRTMVDRARLLNQALEQARRVLSQAGVSWAGVAIPAGTSGGEADRLFREQFAAAAAAAAGRLTVQQLAYAAIHGITASFNDSHTGFVTPEQYRERLAKQYNRAGFTGVGIVLLPRDGRFYVREVVPRSPAETRGVQKFDRIARVNDVATGGLQVDQVASMIRGPSGTQVTLTLERAGQPEPFTVAITRAPIQIPSVFSAKMLEPGIGYLQLYQFVDRTAANVRDSLRTLLDQRMRVLILDLRSNSGGFLHELRAVLNLLLPPGTPAYQEASSGGTRVVRTNGVPLLPPTMPVVVLVDEGSASAAELLAAALQEQGRGVIVGTRTAGAVEASIMVALSDGSALSVTIQRMSSGKGKRLEGAGIAPEIVVELTSADLNLARDTQLARALLSARQRVAQLARPAATMALLPLRR